MSSIFEVSSTPFRPRSFSIWSPEFQGDPPLDPIAEDEALSVKPGQTETEAFIRNGEDNLSPPCFNFKPLDLFLQRAHLGDLTGSKPCVEFRDLCLIDDRTSLLYSYESPPVPQFKQHLNLQDENHISGTSLPHSDNVLFRNIFNEQQLFQRLSEKKTLHGASRRVLFIENLTPLCAVALTNTVATRSHAYILKLFLQAHILGEVAFLTTTYNLNTPFKDNMLKNVYSDLTFAMSFHSSFFALREGCKATFFDQRGFRQSYSMIRSFGDAPDEVIYYDAQVSFLIAGKSETQWTAYCLIDTYQGNGQDPKDYFCRNQDGPSGRVQKGFQSCWNPRGYFLLVLSERVKQTVREWGNIISTLFERLDAYESHYIRTIDTCDLRDNADMTQTRLYMKAVSTLRQFHDGLFSQIDSLQKFLDENLQYFQTSDKELEEQWRGHLDRIVYLMIGLRRRERLLMQRLLRFDSMKDGLINSSALLETRRATKQGDDIGVLTKMTVAYLPFNLAAGIFSISADTPRKLVWIYWIASSIVLGLVTFYFSFWRGVRENWLRSYKEKRQFTK